MIWFISFIIVAVALKYFCPTDSSDKNRWQRSGLIIYTDHATGIQYVKGGMFGGLHVRLGSDGKPL